LPVERITCTLIPGDGVYPELMNSVQTVLKAIGAPIDFETILFSEVQHSSSAKVEDVIKSINRNRICLMVFNKLSLFFFFLIIVYVIQIKFII